MTIFEERIPVYVDRKCTQVPTHGHKAESSVILADDSGKRPFFWSERGGFPA